MDAYFRFAGSVDAEAAQHLDELADILRRDCSLSVNAETEKGSKGSKPVDLTIGLSILSIGISALGPIISVLLYWLSQKPKYSISIKSGMTTVSIDGIKPAKIQEIVSRLEAKRASHDIEVLLSGK